ncbi:hypothetical protein EDC14_101061 [Hydrogenispora ethanolica]|uniref:Uncharacterized protein n=1 Tax=Hydrogenispora ethanolica TaxID=1082276 RepID=A0A4R1RVV0_HYDET|nr:hypothetical protein [Hydrogenispora ethanolica]TCL70072.1 hypothetical protein EDC14_101061 [Hydrogenispora ethanolica]
MNVSGTIDAPGATPYRRSGSVPKAEAGQESFAAIRVQAAAPAGNEPDSIWERLSRDHDIRNATFAELCDISSQLYQAGQITLLDHSIMTFNPSQSPQAVRPNLFLTPAGPDGKRDWIAEYQARIRQDLKLNQTQTAADHRRILEILQRLA